MISINLDDYDKTPTTLDEAVKQLKSVIPDNEQQKIIDGTYEADRAHHGLGRHLRNKWGLWQESKLAKWFNDRGIGHADDMSGIILDTFQRDLRDEPRDLDKQIKHYRDYWKENGNDPDKIGNLGK